MAVDLSKKSWLADLVEEELSGYGPVAARLRWPPELRQPDPDGPSLDARARMLMVRSLRLSRFAAQPGEEEETSAFLSPIRDHLSLILDLALLQGGPFETSRRSAEVAGIFAAATGGGELATAALPRGSEISRTAVRRAFAHAGSWLRDRYFPPGDPREGLPLYAGALVTMRRLLARAAMTYYREGLLERAVLSGYLDQASQELACLAEALLALATAGGPPPPQRQRTVERQIVRLGLARSVAKELGGRLSAPRPAAEIARATPSRVRPFVVEQLLLASVGVEPSPEREQVIAVFAEAAQFGTDQLAALRVEAAAFHANHAQLFRAIGLPEAEWSTLATEWNQAGDDMVERITAVLSDNLEAIVTEIKRTGELGQLLALAAAGKTLTPEEKRKVKAQLIDLARVVPALAIFAAPGGMLLLPLLAKLLPFQLLPSAFHSGGKKRPPPDKKAPKS